MLPPGKYIISRYRCVSANLTLQLINLKIVDRLLFTKCVNQVVLFLIATIIIIKSNEC
jgi:hypothetical protein